MHAAAIVLDIPEKTLLARNEQRKDRNLPAKTIKRQYADSQKSIKSLKKEGFRFVYIFHETDVENLKIAYTKLWNDKATEHGPFDIIGDVHGCCDELEELLSLLGYRNPRNHDEKLERYLNGRNVQITHGLETTVGELDRESDTFKGKLREFLSSLASYYRLDDGKLVVAHAGIRQEYIGRASSRIREFCLYGDTNGDKDDYGLPVRLDWANDYRGNA